MNIVVNGVVNIVVNGVVVGAVVVVLVDVVVGAVVVVLVDVVVGEEVELEPVGAAIAGVGTIIDLMAGNKEPMAKPPTKLTFLSTWRREVWGLFRGSVTAASNR
ncbi:transcription factor MBF1 [Nostoc cycadae WK-1]|uniref:Transcription factor MBF1 n=1 Tax=Nostoc cycadae WK-1 TaxID=1861711 RepID=A0A2H6LK05_9NOSO|nr:transcription factor MBF1 [Nostoc cycadae WK-1]